MEGFMRVASKIAVVAAAAATALSVGLGPALADPPTTTTPNLKSVVGVGAQTTQGLLDAISKSYNATAPANKLWSWDAINPHTGATGDTIITKGSSSTDTTCAIARPDGTSAGVTALSTTKTDNGHPCIDYARASSPPSSSSPSGLVWVGFGQDAVTWVTTNKATGAPKTLTAAQLNAIYSANTGACLTWSDVGGTSTAAIVPALPQTSSGTRSFFLAAIGVTTPGTCVVNGEIDIPGDANNPVLLEENTGISVGGTTTSARTGNQYFFANNPNAVFPYSAADWIAQEAAPAGGGHASAGFGTGAVTEPRDISGISPITLGTPDTIKTKFTTSAATKVFTRIVYNVVPNVGTTTAPAIASGPITTIFGPTGVICSDAATIESWGFLTLGSECGFLTAG
jgi:ABC-type phosphate transport system substrate-binding protein